jgi:hypothetical protein
MNVLTRIWGDWPLPARGYCVSSTSLVEGTVHLRCRRSPQCAYSDCYAIPYERTQILAFGGLLRANANLMYSIPWIYYEVWPDQALLLGRKMSILT